MSLKLKNGSMASCLSFSWLIPQDGSATDLHFIANVLMYFACGVQLALSQLSHLLKDQCTNSTIEKHLGHLWKHFAFGTCPLQFQHILWCFWGYIRDGLWCECDLIQWILLFRRSSHRYELVWTKTLLFTRKYPHAAHEWFATISRGPWVYKNGVSYKNRKNVTWQWLPSLGYT